MTAGSTAFPAFVSRKRVGIAIVWLVAIGGGILSLVVSRRGLLSTSDSAIYLGTTRNILDGHGITSPITLLFTDYFTPLATTHLGGKIPVTTLPPGYSLSLAGLGIFDIGLTTAGRIVGAATFAIALGLLGMMVLRLTAGVWPLAVCVAGLATATGGIYGGFVPGSWLLLSAAALSEAPYLALSFSALFLLARMLQGDRWSDVVWTGLVIGAALLTRYLGVTLLITAGLLILVNRSWSWATRIRRGALLGAVSAAPVVVWVAWTRLTVGQGKSSTPLRLHQLSTLRFSEGLTNVERWFVPPSTPKGLAVAAVVAVVVGFAVLALARPWRAPLPAAERAENTENAEARTPVDWLWACIALYVVVYPLTLVAAHLLVNEGVAFDARFIAPARPLVYVLGVAMVYRALLRYGPKLAFGVTLVGSLGMLVLFVPATADLVRDGALPTARPRSPMADAVRRLPRSALIFSNAPDQLWLDSGRSSIVVPIRRVPEAGLDNSRYRADLRQTAKLLERPNSYVAMYGGYYQSAGLLATTADLERAVPLEVVARYPDGEMLRHAGAADAGG